MLEVEPKYNYCSQTSQVKTPVLTYKLVPIMLRSGVLH